MIERRRQPKQCCIDRVESRRRLAASRKLVEHLRQALENGTQEEKEQALQLKEEDFLCQSPAKKRITTEDVAAPASLD